jgi:hypothetical protein
MAGELALTVSSPVTGTDNSQRILDLVHVNPTKSGEAYTTPAPPPTEFPRFEGENPILLQKAAEKYFRLFAVDPSYQVEYATMHFAGNAALWLRSVESKIDRLTWDHLCELISKQFDRVSIKCCTDNVSS